MTRILVNKDLNETAYKWLHNSCETCDVKNSHTYSFTAGEIHAAFVMGVISHEQYETLAAILDNRFLKESLS